VWDLLEKKHFLFSIGIVVAEEAVVHSDTIYTMSVILATAGYDHRIRFWSAAGGSCTRIVKYPDSQVNKLEITPDKQFIAAAGNPHIKLYDIANTNESQAVLQLDGHTSSVTSIGFQRDGRFLYSGSEDGTVKLWDLRQNTASRSFDVKAPVRSVSLRGDRDEIISGDASGFVSVWDLGGHGRSSDQYMMGKQQQQQHDDTVMIGGVGAESINENEGTASQGHTHGGDGGGGGAMSGIIRSKGSRKKRKGCLQQVQPGRNNTGGCLIQTAIQAVDISYDSRTFVAVSNHGTVYIWDPIPQNFLEKPPITKFRAHPPGSFCLHAKISPDCRLLCTTSSDGSARLFDTTTWELSQSLQKHTKWVWDAAFCADSSYLVTASSDSTARLWNLRSSETVRLYQGHSGACTCVALNDSSV
jgi:target of rapamycin complex subunit LST8